MSFPVPGIPARWAVLVLACTACELPSPPQPVDGADAGLQSGAIRIVLLLLDDSTDGARLSDDAAECASAPWDPDVHRLVIQDSRRDATPITVHTASGPHAVERAGPADPLDGTWLARTLHDADRSFRARTEVLVLSGHTRDWKGFGFRDTDEHELLTATELAGALTDTTRVLVLDSSWSARMELLLPLARLDSAPLVVATTGEVDASGIDHSRPIPDPDATPADLAAWYAEMIPVGGGASGGRAVCIAPGTIEQLPRYARTLSDGLNHTTAAVTDGTVRIAATLAESRTVSRPGSAVIPLSGVARVGGSSVPVAAGELLFYLTEVDYLGVPLGLHPGYHAKDVDTATGTLPPAVGDTGWPDALRAFWSAP